MKNKIIEFNNLYESAIERIKQVQWNLRKYCINHVLTFINEHHIKIDNKPELIQCPIPAINCKLVGIQTKIGMDIATNSSYIGFIKFTLTKESFKTFNFQALKTFELEIYGEHYCKEIVDLKDLEEIRNCAISPNENFLYIKIRIATLEQVNNIIDNFCIIPPKEFSMISYICDCESRITIDTYNGQCPICGKDGPYRRKFKTNCPVCETNTFKDKYGQGECESCGWHIDNLSKKNKNSVIYPNLISLNKAKRLYREGKPLKPDLNDFMEMLYFYSEVEFWYKGLNCCATLREDNRIEFGWSPENIFYFLDKDDFIKNAKIGNEFVRDIWDKVKNPKYI